MIRGFDSYFLHLINGLAGHWFVDCMVSLEEGAYLVKGFFIMAIYIWLWFEGQGPRRNAQRETIIAMLLSSVVAVIIARLLANLLPFRSRPMYVDAHFKAPSFHIASNYEAWSSFPSDHAAIFFALALGVFFMWRGMGAALLAYVALIICSLKIYLGIHYPTDVVVGTLIGLASAWLFFRAKGSNFFRRWISAPALDLERKFPSLFYFIFFIFCCEMGMLYADIRFVARRLFLMLHYAPAKTCVFLCCVAIAIACLGALFWRRLRSTRILMETSDIPK